MNNGELEKISAEESASRAAPYRHELYEWLLERFEHEHPSVVVFLLADRLGDWIAGCFADSPYFEQAVAVSCDWVSSAAHHYATSREEEGET